MLVAGNELDISPTEVSVIFASMVAHRIMFSLLKGTSTEDQKTKSCIVSHVHCAVILVSCLTYWATMPVYVYSSHFMVVGPDAKWEMDWMRLTVSFSLGYFLNDLFLILQYPAVGGYDMLFHHIIVGIFFTSGLLDRCCTPYHFLFMIEETSTPFLNLRWQYRKEKDSTIYVISQAAFVILFFISRILIGTCFVWAHGCMVLPGYISSQVGWMKQAHLWGQLWACSASRVLNAWWMWKIVKIMTRSGGSIKTGFVDESKID